jgi:hypothetical protein
MTPMKFDALEIACCSKGATPGEVERMDAPADSPDYAITIVYGHLPDGGVEALADFYTGDFKLDVELARLTAYRIQFHGETKIDIHDFTGERF